MTSAVYVSAEGAAGVICGFATGTAQGHECGKDPAHLDRHGCRWCGAITLKNARDRWFKDVCVPLAES